MADRIVVYRDEVGDWRWHRIAPNEKRVSTSGEGFDSKRNAVRAAEREAEGTDAEVVMEPAQPEGDDPGVEGRDG